MPCLGCTGPSTKFLGPPTLLVGVSDKNVSYKLLG